MFLLEVLDSKTDQVVLNLEKAVLCFPSSALPYADAYFMSQLCSDSARGFSLLSHASRAGFESGTRGSWFVLWAGARRRAPVRLSLVRSGGRGLCGARAGRAPRGTSSLALVSSL